MAGTPETRDDAKAASKRVPTPSVAKSKVKRLLVSHKEVAEIIGVPTHTVLRWAKGKRSGFPAPVKVMERTYLFSRAEIEAWCHRRTAP